MPPEEGYGVPVGAPLQRGDPPIGEPGAPGLGTGGCMGPTVPGDPALARFGPNTPHAMSPITTMRRTTAPAVMAGLTSDFSLIGIPFTLRQSPDGTLSGSGLSGGKELLMAQETERADTRSLLGVVGRRERQEHAYSIGDET